MTDLRESAKAVLAAWDRIEEAKQGIESIEDRLRVIRPLHDDFQAKLEGMREALTT